MKKPAAVTNHIGKGSKAETLPNRHALNTLTKGDPAQRSMQQYAKAVPGPTDSGNILESYLTSGSSTPSK